VEDQLEDLRQDESDVDAADRWKDTMPPGYSELEVALEVTRGVDPSSTFKNRWAANILLKSIQQFERRTRDEEEWLTLEAPEETDRCWKRQEIARYARREVMILRDVEFYDSVKKKKKLYKVAAVASLVSHCKRDHEGNVFAYFNDQDSAVRAFLSKSCAHFMRRRFKMCHYLGDLSKLCVEHMPPSQRRRGGKLQFHRSDFFLNEQDMAHLARDVLHLMVTYPNAKKADVFFICPEPTVGEIWTSRAALEEKERLCGGYMTMGKFPQHQTLGEGYSWAHIDAYGGIARQAIHRFCCLHLDSEVNMNCEQCRSLCLQLRSPHSAVADGIDGQVVDQVDGQVNDRVDDQAPSRDSPRAGTDGASNGNVSGSDGLKISVLTV